MDFSQTLLHLRKERRLSQEQLAEQLAVSRQAVSKWETGEARPDMDKLVLLCRVLAVSMDTLCGTGVETPTEVQDPAVPRQKRFKPVVIGILMALFLFVVGILAGRWSVLHTAEVPAADIRTIAITDVQYTMSPEATAENPVIKLTIVPSVLNEQIALEILCMSDTGTMDIRPARYDSGVYTVYVPVKSGSSYTLSAIFASGEQRTSVRLADVLDVQALNFTWQALWQA